MTDRATSQRAGSKSIAAAPPTAIDPAGDGAKFQVLYMSGYTEDAITHRSRLDAGVELLRKPFRRAGLAGASGT